MITGDEFYDDDVTSGPLERPRVVEQAVDRLRREASTWRPAHSTRGLSPDHRRIHIAERLRKRTKRRALLVLEAIELGETVPTSPRLARLDGLVGESERLYQAVHP